MKISTSFLLNHRVVIWCKTEEEAWVLLKNVSEVKPELDRHLRPKVERFRIEKESDGLGFRFETFGNRTDVGYGPIYYYRDMSYKIIEFEDLIVAKDYGAFQSGYKTVDAAVAALF